MTDLHTKMMHHALDMAQKAVDAEEVPVGAVVYDAKGVVLAAAHNETKAQNDPTAHAEFLACQRAAKARGDAYLTDCFLAVTLEPCAMCAQALSYYRLKEIRFGAYDVKSGGTVNGARVLDFAHHKPVVLGGVCEEICVDMLQDFFKERR